MVEVINYKNSFYNQYLLNYLSEFIDRILIDFKRENYDVNIVFCDNFFIQNLNKQYRGKNEPTDVLSFSMLEGEDILKLPDEIEQAENDDETDNRHIPLGDIIISIDQAEKQAKDYMVTFEEEMARLAIHGLLHLLGFDHEKFGKDETIMFKKQDEYVIKFLENYSH